MKVLTAAVMFAFGARGIPGADAITNSTATRTFEIKEKEVDVISNAALGSCPQCDISNFIGNDISFFQTTSGTQYLWTIDNLGNSGSQFNQKETSGLQRTFFIGSYSSTSGQVASYTNGSGQFCPINRRGIFEIVLTSAPGQNGRLTASEPQICVYKIEQKCYCVSDIGEIIPFYQNVQIDFMRKYSVLNLFPVHLHHLLHPRAQNHQSGYY
ncbi:predicted protein [Chaetoceros tenuissimus]|uniref:Uncharacterized protein n=1 Tax=Chaetoceros tenuissimus TaxID=426638 RepID=A0AAD3CM42_9STRA|nr:predicted protein [Chaetoceros tenuissimus]